MRPTLDPQTSNQSNMGRKLNWKLGRRTSSTHCFDRLVQTKARISPGLRLAVANPGAVPTKWIMIAANP